MSNYLRCEDCGYTVDEGYVNIAEYEGKACPHCGEVLTTKEQNELLEFVKENPVEVLSQIILGEKKYSVDISPTLLLALLTDPNIKAEQEVLKDLSLLFRIGLKE